jgi:pyruvate dehydrogenase phosphatase
MDSCQYRSDHSICVSHGFQYWLDTDNPSFTSLDHNICFGPLEHLPKTGQTAPADLAVSESPTPAQTFVALAKPAVAGACAISALVDATSDGLYVASAGDCRGVAGWQREDGSWRCDILSEDQMGENPKEIERYVSLPRHFKMLMEGCDPNTQPTSGTKSFDVEECLVDFSQQEHLEMQSTSGPWNRVPRESLLLFSATCVNRQGERNLRG